METYLISAIVALTAAVGVLYEWARSNFVACKLREEKCEEKYQRVLEHLAGIKSFRPDDATLPPASQRA